MHIRWLIKPDLLKVLEIERHSFEFNWNEDDFVRCLRQRNCIGMVADINETVVGFIIYELHKHRLHLLNLAVHEDHRRLGIGKAMILKLIAKLSEGRRRRILLELRESNLVAQLFFKNLGFRAVSVLRRFYDHTEEDAYLMEYRVKKTRTEPINRISSILNE